MKRAVLACLLGLAGCTQTATVPVADETSAAPIPEKHYLTAARSSRVFKLDPQRSLILVKVGRSGPAARLGHDHAIASESLQGYVELADDPNLSRADVAFPLRELLVDKSSYRDRLKLDTQPTEGDIAGTYTNMLKVLMPEKHAWASIAVRQVATAPDSFAVSVTMNGMTHELLLPAVIDVRKNELRLSGSAAISHGDFGLEAFSAVGGLLRVADELDVQFELTAVRLN